MRLVFWISLARYGVARKKSIPVFDHTYFAQGFKHNYFTKLFYRNRNMLNGLYSSKAIVRCAHLVAVFCGLGANLVHVAD